MNPKSVQSSELFGDFDPYTRDWTDGLIALATRKFSNELQQQHGTPEEHAGRPVSSGNNMTNLSEASQVISIWRNIVYFWKYVWWILDGAVCYMILLIKKLS